MAAESGATRTRRRRRWTPRRAGAQAQWPWGRRRVLRQGGWLTVNIRSAGAQLARAPFALTCGCRQLLEDCVNRRGGGRHVGPEPLLQRDEDAQRAVQRGDAPVLRRAEALEERAHS
eukprot:scaffold92360_cov28-Tisochrysis_lutea.AAC.2